MATIEHDDPVVVIIGSGAGGGTVAYELTTRGVTCVVLEAGPHLTGDDYDNDEWPAFSQMAWLDMRTTSAAPGGSRRTSRTCRPGSSRRSAASTTHWAGATPAVPWSTSSGSRTRLRRASTAPTCSTGRSPWTTWRRTTTRPRSRSARRTGTAARRCPRTTTTRCSRTAPSGSATRYYATGPYGTNAEPYDGRPASIQDGFNFQGDKNGVQVEHRWSGRSRGRWPPATCDLRAESQAVQITHDAQRQGRRRPVPRRRGQPAPAGRQVVCVAGNAIETPRLLLLSASSLHPDGLANSSGQVGRNYMRHTTGSVYAQLRQAGAHVPRRDDGRHHRRRGAARHLPRLRRRLLHGDAGARAAVPGRVRRAGRLGPAVHRDDGRLRATPPGCGSSARTCRRSRTGSR